MKDGRAGNDVRRGSGEEYAKTESDHLILKTYILSLRLSRNFPPVLRVMPIDMCGVSKAYSV